jgi:UDP-3-O-[3-hydroxymyristoyl] glucosamine N-acyltransferase
MHLFYGESEIEFLTKGVYDQYIDATANLGKGVTLGKNVKIFSNVVISSNTIIGNNVIILPNTFIGANVKIGDNTIIHDGCSLMFCDIGNNCVIRSGARIGTSGFGFAPNLKTGKHLYIHQIAKVILGNELDIGANTVLDRGCLEDTIVGDNTKIDNLVQIAHGVSIGKSVFIAGQTGIAGSTNVGNFVFMGAQVGVTGHIHIGDYTQIVGKSGIMHSIEENGTVVAGYPAMSKNNWQRINIKLKQLITKKK